MVSVFTDGQIVPRYLVEGFTDLLECLVLDLAYSFFGDTNDLPDLLKREAGVVFLGFDAKSVMNHCSFNFGEIRFVAYHDVPNFCGRLFYMQRSQSFQIV